MNNIVQMRTLAAPTSSHRSFSSLRLVCALLSRWGFPLSVLQVFLSLSVSTSKSHLFAWATPHTIPPQSRINPSKLSAEEKHQQKTYVIFTRWRCCFCCFCFGCCSCAIGSIDGQSFGWVSAVFSTTRPRTCHRDSLRDKYLYSLFYLGFAFSNVLRMDQ